MALKLCGVCSKEFSPAVHWAVYCSKACRDHAHYVVKRDSGYLAERAKQRRAKGER